MWPKVPHFGCFPDKLGTIVDSSCSFSLFEVLNGLKTMWSFDQIWELGALFYVSDVFLTVTSLVTKVPL